MLLRNSLVSLMAGFSFLTGCSSDAPRIDQYELGIVQEAYETTSGDYRISFTPTANPGLKSIYINDDVRKRGGSPTREMLEWKIKRGSYILVPTTDEKGHPLPINTRIDPEDILVINCYHPSWSPEIICR